MTYRHLENHTPTQRKNDTDSSVKKTKSHTRGPFINKYLSSQATHRQISLLVGSTNYLPLQRHIFSSPQRSRRSHEKPEPPRSHNHIDKTHSATYWLTYTTHSYKYQSTLRATPCLPYRKTDITYQPTFLSDQFRKTSNIMSFGTVQTISAIYYSHPYHQEAGTTFKQSVKIPSQPRTFSPCPQLFIPSLIAVLTARTPETGKPNRQTHSQQINIAIYWHIHLHVQIHVHTPTYANNTIHHMRITNHNWQTHTTTHIPIHTHTHLFKHTDINSLPTLSHHPSLTQTMNIAIPLFISYHIY